MPDYKCHEHVFRQGELQPCDRPAEAVRSVPNYPVCVRHARGDMVPLAHLIRQAKAEALREAAETIHQSTYYRDLIQKYADRIAAGGDHDAV